VSEVWITNPNLTPDHDVKIARAALGMYANSGWQVRADQSDPAPDTGEIPAPAPDAAEAAPPLAGDPGPTPDPAPPAKTRTRKDHD
jgi:hypothetical protein